MFTDLVGSTARSTKLDPAEPSFDAVDDCDAFPRLIPIEMVSRIKISMAALPIK